jgi:hypothetical protein
MLEQGNAATSTEGMRGVAFLIALVFTMLVLLWLPRTIRHWRTVRHLYGHVPWDLAFLRDVGGSTG